MVSGPAGPAQSIRGVKDGAGQRKWKREGNGIDAEDKAAAKRRKTGRKIHFRPYPDRAAGGAERGTAADDPGHLEQQRHPEAGPKRRGYPEPAGDQPHHLHPAPLSGSAETRRCGGEGECGGGRAAGRGSHRAGYAGPVQRKRPAPDGRHRIPAGNGPACQGGQRYLRHPEHPRPGKKAGGNPPALRLPAGSGPGRHLLRPQRRPDGDAGHGPDGAAAGHHHG